jgi:alpha-glucosidase (family GH31 glycosyl hydrolase)
MDEKSLIKMQAYANKANMILMGKIRLTLLTDRMLRLEQSEQGCFEDRPSQMVIDRSFSKVDYTVTEQKEEILIYTDRLKICSKKSPEGLRDITVCALRKDGKYTDNWKYGDRTESLKGTARTLDNTDGQTQLDEGIISRSGFTILDDSSTYLIGPEGDLHERRKDHKDVYYFGYGHDYRQCLKDYLKLTGMPPILPRYALGNWWSRYHRYSQEEYRQLILKFEKKEIPLSVAVIDMDWHLTEVDDADASGWTGYSWNRKLFPDPEELLSWLHRQSLKVSLNVHPAEGVHSYEDAYPQFAEAMGYDPDSHKAIQFDATDPVFRQAYFDCLHHPLETQGVDFWWIDWQQGRTCRLPGMDPLWLLNHYHYLDIQRSGKRGLILSRYSGAGSHRYPIGFSGDSIISWDSLAFQPYFTATASNIGYGWWSHDIGGHMMGTYDEELQIRWIQFGVFSPIMRLHSSACVFNHKEPWSYSPGTEQIITGYMQLRHRLIPYLYTMNARFSEEGIPLIQPMYYDEPEQEAAYQCRNEYLFGTEMICVPITGKESEALHLAKTQCYLPKGIYIDLMTGMIYRGDKTIMLYRGISEMPVLLKGGAIVPLDGRKRLTNGTDNPEELTIIVAAGADGNFELYEDDGISLDTAGHVKTKIRLDYENTSALYIEGAKGDLSLIPGKRTYHIRFLGFVKPEDVICMVDHRQAEQEWKYTEKTHEVMVTVRAESKDEIEVQFCGGMQLAANDELRKCFEILDRAEIAYTLKEQIYEVLQSKRSAAGKIMQLTAMEPEEDLKGALMEIMLAQRE